MTHELGAGALASERVYLVEGWHPRDGLDVHDAVGRVGGTFDLLGWALSDMRLLRRIERIVERVGAAVPIAACEGGEHRVRGRVEVIDSVEAPSGERVAAYRAHTERRFVCPCHVQCRATLSVVRCFRETGRLVVRDETGAAIVESGPVVLRDRNGEALDPRSAGELVVRAGDEVDLIGPARREAIAGITVATGYRDGGLPLVFRGDRDAPVYVFAG